MKALRLLVDEYAWILASVATGGAIVAFGYLAAAAYSGVV